MRTVLLVDDNQELVDSEAKHFVGQSSQFELLTARDGLEAITVLEERPVDLLITDLQMPNMDGFELLTRALKLQPDLSILVMSELETDFLELALDTPGSTEVLTKPLPPGILLERARAIFARRTRGYLSGLSLSGFLQLLSLESKSCTIGVLKSGRRGTIELFDGQVTNAFLGNRKGDVALQEILSWRNPDLEMVGTFVSSHREIHDDVQTLLLRAAQAQDEASRDRLRLSRRWIADGAKGTGELPPFELTPKRRKRVQQLLQRLMMLDGCLGAALVDVRTGYTVVAETVQLQVRFEESASEMASVGRSRRHFLQPGAHKTDLKRITVHLERHLEILQPLEAYPLALFLLASRPAIDEDEALERLDNITLKCDAVLREDLSTVTEFLDEGRNQDVRGGEEPAPKEAETAPARLPRRIV